MAIIENSTKPQQLSRGALYHRPYYQNVLGVVATASFVEMFLIDDPITE